MAKKKTKKEEAEEQPVSRGQYVLKFQRNEKDCVGARMHFDDYLEFSLEVDELKTFLKYLKERLALFDWYELNGSMDKSWYYISIKLIRRMSFDYLEPEKPLRLNIDYSEAAVLNRMVKIIQVEIGEENDDQQLFMKIAQEFFQWL